MAKARTLIRNQLVPSHRMLDRRHGVVQPKVVHHTSLLPPAREFPGRIIFVGGSIKALYKSNGTTWTAV